MVSSPRFVLLASLVLIFVWACGDDGTSVTDPGGPPSGANQPPVAQIVSPEDGATVAAGAAVTLEASATDAEDGALPAEALSWSSDVDGELGSGVVQTTGLSSGDHVVTVEATDSDGGVGTASVGITVEPPSEPGGPAGNQSPAASITAPAAQGFFEEGSVVSFAGSATDPEDGAIPGSALVWSSDRDGEIGTGASLESTLSAGEHMITLKAPDSDGATGADSVEVSVGYVEVTYRCGPPCDPTAGWYERSGGREYLHYELPSNPGGDPLRFHASPDGAIPEVYVRHGARPTLSSYDCMTEETESKPNQVRATMTCELPAAPAGDWYIMIVSPDDASSSGVVSAVLVDWPRPDLLVREVQVRPSTFAASDTATATALIENIGEAATTSDVQVRFAWDSVPGSSFGTESTIESGPALEPGDTVTVSMRLPPLVAFGGDISEGPNRLYATADWWDEHDELDEGNNTGSAAFQEHDTPFDLEIWMESSAGNFLSSTQQSLLMQAASRWEEVVLSDASDQGVRWEDVRDYCDSEYTYTSWVTLGVEDLLVIVSVDDIDGAGGTLGQAKPCLGRSESESYRPYLGWLVFDRADVDGMGDAAFSALALHELGHTLGIGSGYWDLLGLKSGSTFTGLEASDAYHKAGGPTGGVPIESSGGDGVAGGHWSESALGDELMTPFLDAGAPLSAVTAGALVDAGYAVDFGAADEFTLGAGLMAEAIYVGNDAMGDPYYVQDRKGRIKPLREVVRH